MWLVVRTPGGHLIYISLAESDSVLIGIAPRSVFSGLYRVSCGDRHQVFLHFHFKAFYHRDTHRMSSRRTKQGGRARMRIALATRAMAAVSETEAPWEDGPGKETLPSATRILCLDCGAVR